MTAAVGSARAEGPGSASLKSARAAFDGGDFAGAEPLFKEAIEKGGLSPKEVLDAYVRLGCTRAILGKKDGATLAFKAASVIDSHFVVPPEAGKKSIQLAEKARRDTARIGGIVLRATVPQTSTAASPIKVEASIDEAHADPRAPLVAKLGVYSKDSVGGKEYTHTEPIATKVTFEIPASAFSAGSTVTVRVDALDARDNRLASVEEKVKIDGVAQAPIAETPEPSTAPTTSNKMPEPPPPLADKKQTGSFWSSPWPYILGGIALGAGGAVVYFGTRPTDDVTVGSPTIRGQ
jgi:hypothetical protein